MTANYVFDDRFRRLSATLNKGTQLRRLAVMDNWSYVEYTGKEKIRGFVLSEDIEVIDDEYNQ